MSERRQYNLGGDHFPTSGRSEDEPLLSTADRQALLENWGVPLDLEERFEKTVAEAGYQTVKELPNGWQVPSIDEWLAFRGANPLEWRRHAPALVENEQGERFFCKVRVGRLPETGSDLQREAAVLEAIPPDVMAPKVVRYIPESEDGAEVLITEYVSFSDFSPPETVSQIDPTIVHSIAQGIRSLENVPVTDLPENLQQPKERIEPHWEEALPVLQEGFRGRGQEFIDSYLKENPSSVFIHGDVWTGNLLIKSGNESQLRIVDWERGGAGYAGEDAGRLLFQLWSDQNVASQFIDAYVSADSPEDASARKIRLQFGTVFLALRAITDRLRKMKAGYKPELHDAWRKDFTTLQETALTIVEAITEANT